MWQLTLITRVKDRQLNEDDLYMFNIIFKKKP